MSNVSNRRKKTVTKQCINRDYSTTPNLIGETVYICQCNEVAFGDFNLESDVWQGKNYLENYRTSRLEDNDKRKETPEKCYLASLNPLHQSKMSDRASHHYTSDLYFHRPQIKLSLLDYLVYSCKKCRNSPSTYKFYLQR